MGTTRFGKQLRYCAVISEASTAGSAEDLDITHQMEAFLHALCDNNISKWKKSVQLLAKLNKGSRQYEQIKVSDTKVRAQELNDNEHKLYTQLCECHDTSMMKYLLKIEWAVKVFCDAYAMPSLCYY